MVLAFFAHGSGPTAGFITVTILGPIQRRTDLLTNPAVKDNIIP
jgi:hypothetical protein